MPRSLGPVDPQSPLKPPGQKVDQQLDSSRVARLGQKKHSLSSPYRDVSLLIKKPNISSVILSCLQSKDRTGLTTHMLTKPRDQANKSMITTLQQ